MEKFAEYEKRGRRSIELAEPVIARHRIPLAVENHKTYRIAEFVSLLSHVASPWVGVCLTRATTWRFWKTRSKSSTRWRMDRGRTPEGPGRAGV